MVTQDLKMEGGGSGGEGEDEDEEKPAERNAEMTKKRASLKMPKAP